MSSHVSLLKLKDVILGCVDQLYVAVTKCQNKIAQRVNYLFKCLTSGGSVQIPWLLILHLQYSRPWLSRVQGRSSSCQQTRNTQREAYGRSTGFKYCSQRPILHLGESFKSSRHMITCSMHGSLGKNISALQKIHCSKESLFVFLNPN